GGRAGGGEAGPNDASTIDRTEPDDTGVTDAATKTCPSACRRGLYLSLYTDRIGQVTFDGPLDAYRHILGDPQKEQRVLDYVRAREINALTLYDLGDAAVDA